MRWNVHSISRTLIAIGAAAVLFSGEAKATHIVGGELNYRCLGGTLYEIRLKVFRDCYTGVPPFDNPAAVGIFNASNQLVQTLYLTFPGSQLIPPTINQTDQCVVIPTDICVEATEYVGTVNLPNIPGGYKLSYQRCCRNPTIVNVPNPGNVGATYYATIPPSTLVSCNSNPVINNWPPVFVCVDMELNFDHSATDYDGDSLVYRLCTPFNSPSNNPRPQPPYAPPYSNITWQAPYNQTDPLGGIPLTIDQNGQLTGTPNRVGQFVVGVCVDEYRNGQLISTTKRDFQFNVLRCEKDVVAAVYTSTVNCLNRTVSFVNGSSGAVSYLWNFGDPTAAPNDTSTSPSPLWTYTSTGTYTVQLIAYSGNSSACNDTLYSYVVIVDSCRSCDINLSKNDASVCQLYCDTVIQTCSQVYHDTTTYAQMNSPGSNYNLQWNHTTGTGVNRALFLTLHWYGSGSPSTPTYGATAMTSQGLTQSGSYGSTAYYLLNPATGSNQVSFTLPSTMTNVVAVMSSYFCVRQSGWNGASVSSGTGIPITYTQGGCTAGDMVVSSLTISTNDVTGAGAGQAPRASNVNQGSLYVWRSDEVAVGANTVMDYVGGNAGTIKMHNMVRITPSGGGTPDTTLVCSGGGAGDGTIDLSVSGGSAPYNYSWDNGATTQDQNGLAPGVYKVTVYDNGTCVDTGSVVIDGNSVISVNATMSPASCGVSDGTVTVSVTGGSGTYLWNTGHTTQTVTGLPPGIYNVIVTDSVACSRSDTVRITESTVISVSPNKTDVLCFGGSSGTATITPVNGNPPYTYYWSPGGQTGPSATGLSAGTYTVSVDDATGCSGVQSFTITQPPQLTVSSAPPPVSCYGDATSVTATPSGGTPGYNYNWSDGQTGATATGITQGSYSVTVTDANGCTATTTVNLSGPFPLLPEISDISTIDCPGNFNGGADALITGGTPVYNFLWCDGQTVQTVTGLPTGQCRLTVTDANGCTAIDSITITDPGPVSLTMSISPMLVCPGDSDGFATVQPTGGTPGYTFLWCTGETTQSITDLKAGPCIVTVTDAQGCTDTITAVVTEPAPLAPNPTASNVTCNAAGDGIITATPSGGTPGYTYLWDDAGSSTTASVSGLSPGTYNVTITDAAGCTSTGQTTITEPTTLTATPSNNPASCGQPDGDATVAASGGTPGYTYIWNDAAGHTGATATGLSAGTYTVTVTDANGCTQVVSTSISDLSAPTTTTNGTNLLCYGDSNGTATVVPSGGTPGYNYVWDDPGSQTGATATGLTAGTYNITVTDVNGCIATDVYIVTQPTAVTLLTPAGTDVSCRGGSDGTAVVTPSGGTAPYTYIWSNNQTDSTATGLTAGTYTVTVSDQNGCTGPGSVTVTVTEPSADLNGTATPTDARCNGSSDGTATVTGSGGTSPYTYLWSDANSHTAATATGLSAGTYTVTVTDANGCTNVNTITVAIGQPAVLSTGTSKTDALCLGSGDGTATVTPAGGTSPFTYSWSNNQTDSTATGLTAGTYTVTVTDANNCSATTTVSIGQPTGLSMTLDSTDALCGQGTGTATVSPSGGTPGYTYLWSDANGQTGATATGLLTGTYTVTVTDQNGCTMTGTVSVRSSPSTIATATGSDLSCNGGADGTATVNATNGSPPYTYLWSDAGGQTGVTATGLPPGTYTVTVTDLYGCDTTTTVTISQPPPLVISLGPDTGACDNITITIGGTPGGGTPGYTYIWNDAAGSTTQSITVSNTTTNTYVVTVTDQNGCTATDDVRLTSNPLPVPDYSFTFVPTCNGLEVTFINNSTNGTTYLWRFGDGTTSSDPNPIHHFDYNTVNRNILVVSNGGCTDSIALTDSIHNFDYYQDIRIPNVFTPNGDGLNDYFFIPTTGDLSECTFLKMILNRWGVKIYEPPMGKLSWDGHTVAGVEVPEGTYYYIVRIKDKDFAGWVHLIRDQK